MEDQRGNKENIEPQIEDVDENGEVKTRLNIKGKTGSGKRLGKTKVVVRGGRIRKDDDS